MERCNKDWRAMSDWLNEFRIAVINANVPTIISLHDSLPNNLDLESMLKAKSLIDEAIIMLENEQEKTIKAIESLRKSKEYTFTNKKPVRGFDNKS